MLKRQMVIHKKAVSMPTRVVQYPAKGTITEAVLGSQPALSVASRMLQFVKMLPTRWLSAQPEVMTHP
jgi:hypothetical protein